MIHYRKDYKKSSYQIKETNLDFTIHPTKTIVVNTMQMHQVEKEDLVLNGEYMTLLCVKINGVEVKDYQLDKHFLTLSNLPVDFTLEITTQIDPQNNNRLFGLYLSRGIYCTQNEPEGFRSITYYLDRPDVLSTFTTTIHADRKKLPILLSNGNKIKDTGDTVVWHDPFPKPCYLFALVAGDLDCIKDTFETKSGRQVNLHLYCETGKAERLKFAMESLKKAMKWDEEAFNREYDLDLFNIVAVSDFNAGAMENKSLNIFNDSCLLADPMTATDATFEFVERVVAHEYCHNWSGDRVTARDWFNLSLKEGFTVYRDQEFSYAVRSKAVGRIDDVFDLKNSQFLEDDGPLAHPVRPDSYMAIDNFYTSTIYNKGAEVIRMQESLVGTEGFKRGCDLYFDRHDGQAVTIDDFVKAIEDANNTKFTGFMNWYSVAGRPEVIAKTSYKNHTFTLTLTQKTKNTDAVFVIPLRMGLVGKNGDILNQTLIFNQKEQTFVFKDIMEKPVISLNRFFAAPITLKIKYTKAERRFLMKNDTDCFNRYEIGQLYAEDCILKMVKKDKKLPKDFLDDLGSYLDLFNTDNAFVARALTLPTITQIANRLKIFDIEKLDKVLKSVKKAFAQKYEKELLNIYQTLNIKEPYSPDAQQAGNRALKNVAMRYLAYLPNSDFILEQYKNADNLTDLIAALSELVIHKIKGYKWALSDFYKKYQDDHIVINKWLMYSAMRSDISIAKMNTIMKNKAFDIRNPNKVRSLIGGFCHNLKAFHNPDGSGYRFLSDLIIKIDPQNPKLAENLLHALTRPKHFLNPRRSLIKKELRRILKTKDLSINLTELIEKALK